MREDGVRLCVDADAARKARKRQQRSGQGALVLKIRMGRSIPHLRVFVLDAQAIPIGFRKRSESRKLGGGHARVWPQFLPYSAEAHVHSLLHEIDDRAVI